MTIVWIVLVAALLVTLALCTVMLVRKFIALLQAFADFVSLPAILDGVHRADAEERPTPAVLLPLALASARHSSRRPRTADRRADRRAGRLTRARALIRADVNALK
jgi:hypothetical protein